MKSPSGWMGSARGVLQSATPGTRLLGGLFVFLSVLLAPLPTRAGAVVVMSGVASWVALTGLSLGAVARLTALGGVLLSPYLLLAVVFPVEDGPAIVELGVPLSVVAKGIGGMLVSISTLAALNPSSFRTGLESLRAPRTVISLLAQILQQTGTLWSETQRMSQALKVRAAVGGRFSHWRAVAALPRVWLPRLLDRAERVGAAMEVRGYVEPYSARRPAAVVAPFDLLVLVACAVLLTTSLFIRWGGVA